MALLNNSVNDGSTINSIPAGRLLQSALRDIYNSKTRTRGNAFKIFVRDKLISYFKGHLNFIGDVAAGSSLNTTGKNVFVGAGYNTKTKSPNTLYLIVNPGANTSTDFVVRYVTKSGQIHNVYISCMESLNGMFKATLADMPASTDIIIFNVLEAGTTGSSICIFKGDKITRGVFREHLIKTYNEKIAKMEQELSLQLEEERMGIDMKVTIKPRFVPSLYFKFNVTPNNSLKSLMKLDCVYVIPRGVPYDASKIGRANSKRQTYLVEAMAIASSL